MRFVIDLLYITLFIVLQQLVQEYFRVFIAYKTLGGFLNIVTVWNKGISFGMLHTFAYVNLFFLLIAIGISIFLLITLYKTTEPWLCIALRLIVAGAIGNSLDRIRFGAVYDFIDIHFYHLHWPAFNLADAYICLGIGIMLFLQFYVRKK